MGRFETVKLPRIELSASLVNGVSVIRVVVILTSRQLPDHLLKIGVYTDAPTHTLVVIKRNAEVFFYSRLFVTARTDNWAVSRLIFEKESESSLSATKVSGCRVATI